MLPERTNGLPARETENLMNAKLGLFFIVTLLVTSGVAAQANLSAEASSDVGAAPEPAAGPPESERAGDRDEEPWSTRWAPEAGTWEFGAFAGLLLPENKLELFDADRSKHRAFKDTNLEVGLRAGFYPLSWLGLEAEGAVSPAKTDASGDKAVIWAVRGQALLQVPSWTITPFAVLGGGAMGVGSDNAVVGDDADGTLHAGVGLKAYLGRHAALRLDIRDNFTPAVGSGLSQTWEALLGVSIVAGRAGDLYKPPVDADGDGVADDTDACLDEVGVAPTGCPVRDADGDGVPDADDACPHTAGVVNADRSTNGCPLPVVADRDGDGVADGADACPDLAAATPDGCPGDTDGDGIRDDKDKCADKPETPNAFEDDDGCPDEVPAAVQQFTGVIRGIVFDTNKATIQAKSFVELDKAVKVLAEYSALRVEISGHTDSSGKAERNQTLSRERADAVKKYLVDAGIDASRIETRGAGSAEPIGDNATAAGKAANRRIEFKLLK